MIMLLILAVFVLTAIVGTIRAIANDGYGQIATRDMCEL